jgi:O-antigen ligase
MMLNKTMKYILILLFIFTPIAFGAMEIWAFSLMALGILLLVVLWAIQNLLRNAPAYRSGRDCGLRNFRYEILFISIFLALILFQIIPLPSGIVKILSPKTYELRQSLSVFNSELLTFNSKLTFSFVPFLTKIEFYKWLTLSAFFLFLLHWKYFGDGFRIANQLLIVIFLTGVFESLYGVFEFFSGHQHILYLEGISSVTGTFINRNYFAGYLLMVIPLSMGLFFSREALHAGRFKGWRQRLSSLDGKTLLIGFGIIVMILGLLFSASRMGILSLLLSFTLISIFFKASQTGKGFSRTTILILGLALLWALWIGLDTVIGRFFNLSEDLRWRWALWGDTSKIVLDFPILGSGLGTFSQIFPMYKSFHIRRFVSHAENDFLQLASEVGLIGSGILFILFVVFFLKALSRIRSMSTTDSRRYIGIGGLVAILALMFHSLVERNLQVPANAFLYTFLWALVLRMATHRPGAKVIKGD